MAHTRNEIPARRGGVHRGSIRDTGRRRQRCVWLYVAPDWLHRPLSSIHPSSRSTISRSIVHRGGMGGGHHRWQSSSCVLVVCYSGDWWVVIRAGGASACASAAVAQCDIHRLGLVMRVFLCMLRCEAQYAPIVHTRARVCLCVVCGCVCGCVCVAMPGGLPYMYYAQCA